MGPLVPGGNEGNVARSIWYMSELFGGSLGSGWEILNSGVTELMSTPILTFGTLPPEVVQVLVSTPNSATLNRNSQIRCDVAEFKLGPNPSAPNEAGATGWQLVSAYWLNRVALTKGRPSWQVP